MVLIKPNPSEDLQGTQLRVNKKLTTVCSGKRSRFSKPRPNLSIPKRGEANIPANAGKTSRSSEPEVSQTVLNLNTDSKEKSQEEAISHEVLSHKDLNSQKRIEESIKISFEDNVFKNSHEKEVEIPSLKDQMCEKSIGEDFKVLSFDDAIKNVKDSIENVPYKDAKILDSEGISGFSDNVEYQISNTENFSPNEESQAISNTDREEISPVEENDISTNRATDNTSKDCDIIETSPVKNSGKLLKISEESEKRSTSNITPTVIDKSKYPHLTSILSKKRTEPQKETRQKRRKKFRKGCVPPERSKMTMADLIYWNPAKTDEPHKSTVTESETSCTNVIIEEENVDDSLESENNIIDSVPKLVISEDGQINIDQSSLFVSRNIPQPTTTEVVRKDDTTYSSFRKRPLTKHWTSKDTANFYRALSLVGADFSLMEQIFPNRSRRELKQKFKREEKFNIDLINKVLYESSQTFDELTLHAFIDQNNANDYSDSTNEEDADAKEKSRKKRTSEKTESTNNETSVSSTDFLLEEITVENEKPENKKKKKKKTKKLSDDEDVEIIVGDFTNYNDVGELKSSKRKRCVKKLPEDFINLDSVEELDIWNDDETNDQEILDASEKESAIESQEYGNEIENGNDIETENVEEEILSESACVILDKIMNGADNTDNEQNHKKKVCDATVSLPVITNHDEEYISVEYIKNDDSDADLCMLSNVVAYEVVNTQTKPPRKKRKINSISPLKTRDYLFSTKISPASYTNYTPV